MADTTAAPAAKITPPAAKPWAPPLDIARDIGRDAIARAEHIDYDLASSVSLAATVGDLRAALRFVLDALDAEDGR